MKISKGLLQSYQLQDFAFEAAMSLKESLAGKDGKLTITREDAQSISALVKSWEACQYRIQVHRRVPNPGSLTHKAVARVPKGRQSAGRVQSDEPLAEPA